MSIVIIRGPAKSGKSLIANALRNNQIAFGKGALLVDETQDGGVKPLLEKLLKAVELPAKPPADLATLPWKPSPMVILVGGKEAMLATFEAALPGFRKFFGPVYRIETGKDAD